MVPRESRLAVRWHTGCALVVLGTFLPAVEHRAVWFVGEPAKSFQGSLLDLSVAAPLSPAFEYPVPGQHSDWFHARVGDEMLGSGVGELFLAWAFAIGAVVAWRVRWRGLVWVGALLVVVLLTFDGARLHRYLASLERKRDDYESAGLSPAAWLGFAFGLALAGQASFSIWVEGRRGRRFEKTFD